MSTATEAGAIELLHDIVQKQAAAIDKLERRLFCAEGLLLPFVCHLVDVTGDPALREILTQAQTTAARLMPEVAEAGVDKPRIVTPSSLIVVK